MYCFIVFQSVNKRLSKIVVLKWGKVFERNRCPVWVCGTNMKRRTQNSYTAPCNSVASRGAPIGGIQVFTYHTCGNSTNKMRPWFSRTAHGISCVFIFILGSQIICAWQITVILIAGKTQIPSIWAPCQNKDGAGSGTSGLYLQSLVYWSQATRICDAFQQNREQVAQAYFEIWAIEVGMGVKSDHLSILRFWGFLRTVTCLLSPSCNLWLIFKHFPTEISAFSASCHIQNYRNRKL